MRALRVASDILPIGEFKAHASRVVSEVRDGGGAVVLTQHGRPAAVLISPQDYDRLTARDRFTAAVQEGLQDVVAGRTLSDEDLAAEMDQLFGPEPT